MFMSVYFRGRWECTFLFLGLPNKCIINVLDDIRISFPKMSMINIKCSLLSQCDESIKFKVFGVLNYGTIEILKNGIGIYTSPDNNATQNLLFVHSDIKDDEIMRPEQYGNDPNLEVLYNELRCAQFHTDTRKIKYQQFFPKWNDPLCKEIRKLFPIDLSGKTVINQASYIMRCINRYFIPGTMVEVPEYCSAIYYLNHPKSPMNCRTYSIVANDVLNAWGIKARAIHCLPKNEYDIESHFINEVYIKDLDKWVLLDAAFGCLIRNEKSFLNVKEVRERIIANKPLYVYSSPQTQKANINTASYWEMLVKDFYCFTYYLDYSIGYNSLPSNEILVLPDGYQSHKYINTPKTNNIDQFY